MANERSTDERGRITIPQELRERFGEDYRVVELHDGIKLVPVPEDPVAALRDAAGEDLRGTAPDALRAAARRAATERTTDGA